MKAFFAMLLFFSISSGISAQITDSIKDLQKHDGYFNFYYSPKKDKIYLQVDKLDKDFLYVEFLSSGIGSNDVGLDRGQLGNEAVVRFHKAGNKILLIEPNLKYRAETTNVQEKESVAEAFAKSVLYGFEIKEEKDGKYIIDLTPFLLEDNHKVADKLKRGNFGSFSLNKSRSALSLDRTKAFPQNVEFESLLTFSGETKAATLRNVLPDPDNITVTQHLSFVKLPDDGYKKRIFMPGSGAIFTSYYDYSTPVFEPIEKRYVIRHRLEKKNPDAKISEAVKPIVYYLDPGTPEPVRTALLEGARWWNQAFEAIGYKDAFQVKMLPEGADMLDVRYNVIQWVHRSTRGWSYGASVIDPRTGEIIKGHVSLGSLRIRQDFLLAQALLNKPFAEGDENYQEMMKMAVARIHQLAAHEVGHTLGFAHNFAASTRNDASVMDYPHPKITLQKNGDISVDNAYDTGIGEWDKVTVKYSYGDIPKDASEKKYLASVLEDASKSGLQFITDSDARAQGGAHINAHLWDNGKNPSEELERVLKVRKQAIENFSTDNFRSGEPYSVLEDVFVPLYFFHRYQTEAATKLVGGLDYNYALKGDHNLVVKVLPKKLQEDALNNVLKTLSAETLAIPKDKLELFPPRAYGYGRTRESFKSETGVAFDALGAAGTASDMTLSLLLNPERAARLVQHKAVDKNQLGLQEVLTTLISKTIKSSEKDDYLQQVQNTINYNVLQHLMNLAVHKKATAQVRADANAAINEIADFLKDKEDAFSKQLLAEINNFKKEPSEFKPLPDAPKIPDGSPIGSFLQEDLPDY